MYEYRIISVLIQIQKGLMKRNDSLRTRADESDEYHNATRSIRIKWKLDSNVINDSSWHAEKHHESKISTFRGTTIE
jgi:hypothetical protein